MTCTLSGQTRSVDLVKRNFYTVWVRFGGALIKRHIRKHHVQELD